MSKTAYRVTEAAASHVNGDRVRPGDRLELTEAEALYERDLGHIAPEPVEPPAPAGKRAPRAATAPVEPSAD